MLPAPMQIVKCPNCLKPFQYGGWLSGNTFGATLWSDGMMEGPMYPESDDPAVRCPGCQSFFLMRDNVIKGISTKDFSERVPFLAQRLSIPEVKLLLDNPSLRPFKKPRERRVATGDTPPPPERPIQISASTLKHCLVLKINDIRREGGIPDDDLEQLFNAAIRELINELKEDDEFYLVLKAEFCRNLGDFAGAKRFLKRVNDSEFKQAKAKLLMAVFFRRRKLFKIYAGESDRKSIVERIKKWYRRRFSG